jgi:hypothetical protein
MIYDNNYEFPTPTALFTQLITPELDEDDAEEEEMRNNNAMQDQVAKEEAETTASPRTPKTASIKVNKVIKTFSYYHLPDARNSDT